MEKGGRRSQIPYLENSQRGMSQTLRPETLSEDLRWMELQVFFSSSMFLSTFFMLRGIFFVDHVLQS